MAIIKKEIGHLGEREAVRFLKKSKYKILATNYSTKYGEIDLICENKEYIVFVEVKTRKRDALVSGSFAVNSLKQQHIFRAAVTYMNEFPSDKQPRFDIIEVEYLESSNTTKVTEHYVNAFEQRGDYAVF